MTYRISKTFSFAAAHHLPHLPEGHKCRRPHGHTYTVELVLEANHTDRRGFVMDYAELNDFKSWVENTLDHQDLNEVITQVSMAPQYPTAELLAAWFYGVALRLKLPVKEVTVKESPEASATYFERY